MTKIVFDHDKETFNDAVGLSPADLKKILAELAIMIVKHPSSLRSVMLEEIMRKAQDDERVLMAILEDWMSNSMEKHLEKIHARLTERAEKVKSSLPDEVRQRLKTFSINHAEDPDHADRVLEQARAAGMDIPDDLMIVLNHECEKCRAYDVCTSPDKKSREEIQGMLQTKAQGELH